jgi:hypothetical protein
MVQQESRPGTTVETRFAEPSTARYGVPPPVSAVVRSKDMNRTIRIEIICQSVLIGAATILYIVMGLFLLFGPPEIRLARTAHTLGIAFTWAIATWLFYCLLIISLCRVAFFIVNLVARRRRGSNTSLNPTEGS